MPVGPNDQSYWDNSFNLLTNPQNAWLQNQWIQQNHPLNEGSNFHFSGGGAPGSAPSGTGATYGSSGGTINAVTQPGVGGTLTNAAGGASVPWWQTAATWAQNNPNLVGAGLGAVSGYLQGSQGGQGGSVAGNTSTGPYMADVLNPYLMEILQGQQGLYRGAVAGGGGGGGGGGGRASWESLAPDYGGVGLMNQAGQAGLNFDQNPLAQANLSALGQVTGNQGMSGMAGYNPMAEQLAQAVGGSSMGRPNQLLEQFIGQGYGAQAPGGSLGGSSFSGGGGGGFIGGGGGGGGAGGIVPDASGNGLFGTQVRKIFDEQANEQVLSDLISASSNDAMSAHWAALADLDASSQQGGRLGGSYYNQLRGNQQGALDDAIAGMSAGVRYQDLDARRQAVLQALGQVNTRDISAMGDMTQRAGINASSRAAAGQTAAQRYSAELAHALGLRGQDLSAIGMMSGNEQFGLGTMGQLAGLRSGDFAGALSGLGGLSTLGMQGVGLGLGAGQALGNYQLGLGGLGQSDAARRSAAANRAASAPQDALNQALRTYATIGSLGQTGTSNTQYPGQGGSALGGALQGAIGGWLAGNNFKTQGATA